MIRRIASCLLFLSLSFCATAQRQADHQVKISIPGILILKLSDIQGSSFTLPLAVTIVAGKVQLNPASTDLQIFANQNWQLMVSVDDSSLGVSAATLQGDVRLQAYPKILLRGGLTQGWQTQHIDYRLESPLYQGNFQVNITYSLVRP